MTHLSAGFMKKSFQNALTSTYFPIFITNTQGRIRFVNDAFCRIFKYAPAEAINLSLKQLKLEIIKKTPGDYCRLSYGKSPVLEALGNGGTAKALTQSGEEITLVLSVIPFEEKQHKYFCCIAYDLSRFTLTENKFKAAMEALEFGVWEWKMSENKVIWDDTMFTLYGTEKASFDFSYQYWLNRIHEGDREHADAAVKDAYRNLKPFETSFRIITPEGTVKRIQAYAKYLYDQKHHVQSMIGINWDITYKSKLEDHIIQIANIQRQCLSENNENIYDELLKHILTLTSSEYGFIGSVLKDSGDQKFLKTHAISNIAWNRETREFYNKNAPSGLEFRNLDTLFGHTLKTGETVLANDPKHDPRAGGLPQGHPAMHHYLGLPIFTKDDQLTAMMGIANKAGGYSQQDVELLSPVVTNSVGALIAFNEKLKHVEKIAGKDELTDTHNRRYLETVMKQKIAKGIDPFAIFLIDLNHFKDINDIYGHQIGDMILTRFAKRIQKVIKASDVLARIGGDEFIVMTEIAREKDAVVIAKAILTQSKIRYALPAGRIECFASIGVAFFPQSSTSLNGLFTSADFALYEAKRNKSYTIYNQRLAKKHKRTQKIKTLVSNILEKKQFYMQYQPVVDLKKKCLRSIEALLRFDVCLPRRISISDIVTAIETAGYAHQLNQAILEKVLADIDSVTPSSPIIVSINISPNTGHLRQTLEHVRKAFHQHKKENISFEIEITESAIKHYQSKRLMQAIQNIQKDDIRIALDDFGSGYSSLNRMVEIGFNTLKIDRSFVDRLNAEETTSTLAIFEAVFLIGKRLNIDIIIEGIETKSQFDIIRKIGGRYMQGYYFSKPVALKKALQFDLKSR